eukprot:COSAG04_NODE_24214_length_325_cov_0.827434_1_plen_48_part_10
MCPILTCIPPYARDVCLLITHILHSLNMRRLGLVGRRPLAQHLRRILL